MPGLAHGARQRLITAAVLAGLVVLGYLLLPGHTYLQEDSQIYLAILEHFWNPTVLANDPVATHHHMSYTIYDELALLWRRITGLDFQPILVADQLVFRFLGLLGIYLTATALGLGRAPALAVAAVFGLGATVSGPAVLTIEYEPKPRASAVPAAFLAIGLFAHGRFLGAGLAGALSFLYHPPSSYPFWLASLVWLGVARQRRTQARALQLLIPGTVAIGILLLAAHFQVGGKEPGLWFSQLTPELEQIQRYRASYNWVSTWWERWAWHYALLFLASIVAWRRLRLDWRSPSGWMSLSLPIIGLASVPASWLLLEHLKWALIPKFQPARALLMVPAFAVILAVARAITGARTLRGALESMAWAVIAFAVPTGPDIRQVLLPNLASPVALHRLLLILGLAALLVFSRWLSARPLATLTTAAALLAPYFLLPTAGRVENYQVIHHPELDELARWARSHTPREAVFVFPLADRSRVPGVFRVKAQRALYVDWKSGGQANMLPALAWEWWCRWQTIQRTGFNEAALAKYRDLGIDFVVVERSQALLGYKPVFENRRYSVYSTAAQPEAGSTGG